MKTSILIVILILIASSSFAEEPRTVGVYKRHIATENHAKEFDHNVHHMLYLSGVADGFTTINRQREASREELLFCLPKDTSLSGKDYMQILQHKLEQTVDPVPDSSTVAEAILIALKEKFPCQGQ